MKNWFLISILAVAVQNGHAQDFVNLDFEDAIITHDPSTGYPNAVYATDAIPGWIPTGFIGPNDVLYNTASAGSTSVSILDVNGHPSALDGAFSVYLYGGGGEPAASIGQTGLVPVGTESILFEAEYFGLTAGTGTLLVSLGGQNITFFALSTVSPYTSFYGGNILSTFSGQSEQLIFSALAGENFWNIDDIQFSSSPVPEPSEFALGALGALLLGCRRWRNF